MSIEESLGLALKEIARLNDNVSALSKIVVDKTKPLTDDEIFLIAEKHGAFEFGDAQGDVTLAFVKDIEERHGIFHIPF